MLIKEMLFAVDVEVTRLPCRCGSGPTTTTVRARLALATDPRNPSRIVAEASAADTEALRTASRQALICRRCEA